MYNNYVENNEMMDNFYSKFNITPDSLDSLNGYNVDSNTFTMVPNGNSKYFDYYTVVSGDTIFMGNNE